MGEDVRIETGGGRFLVEAGRHAAGAGGYGVLLFQREDRTEATLRDENAPPLSVDLTDMDGLAQVEKEMGEERSDGDEDAAGVDERE